MCGGWKWHRFNLNGPWKKLRMTPTVHALFWVTFNERAMLKDHTSNWHERTQYIGTRRSGFCYVIFPEHRHGRFKVSHRKWVWQKRRGSLSSRYVLRTLSFPIRPSSITFNIPLPRQYLTIDMDRGYATQLANFKTGHSLTSHLAACGA